MRRERTQALCSLLACTAGIFALTGCSALEEYIQRDGREGLVIGGMQTGLWTYAYPNGVTSAQGEYRSDRQFGPWTYWYANGEKEWDVTFGADAIEGPSTFYFESGQKRAEGSFHAGFEDGIWRFWSQSGDLVREGQYAAGLPSGSWTYFHAGGQKQAEGFYFEGEPVGHWSFWDAAGNEYSQTFPLPDDLMVFVERFGGGPSRREGFGTRMRREGRWVSYHSSGKRRAQGSFRKGKHEGTWSFYTPDGELLALGEMRSGLFRGRWEVRDGSRMKTVSATRMGTLEAFRGEWSPDDLASTTTPLEAIREWAEEIDKPFAGGSGQPAPGSRTPPPPALAAVAQAEFELPLRPQPWTESELQAQDYLVQLYTEGAEAAEPPPGSKYAAPKAKEVEDKSVLKAYGDLVSAENLLGKSLPVQSFLTLNGLPYDIGQHKGHKPVVAVILRGVQREVCVYCFAQTEAILNEIDSFQAAGAEVVVIYPGPQNRIDAFVSLVYKEVEEGRSFDKVSILYDPGMASVNEMGIRAAMAIPSTFILDREGIVRYAYVGVSDEDRPSTKDLLGALSKLPNP